MSAITLYSDRDFAGTAVPLDEGHTRFTTDFNDGACSIRVSPGYCAILYEHANEFGGYGAAIDLLEDCPDLSVYGFDKKTSFVQVFPSEREGFIWARGAMRNGEFVPGHWERKRANGSTPNTSVAVVAPPIPPRTAPIVETTGPIEVRDHRGNGADGGDEPVIRDHRKSRIKHVFVLMLENRSFDHMLGFSGITGTDAATGQPTKIDGLTGAEYNTYKGKKYTVKRGAPDRVEHDPPHSFTGVLEQLCGEGAVFRSRGAYPPINNSGFVSAYAKSHPELPDGAMRCFTPEQVPVITALAKEFCVCDHWFSSMPGPTEPNRWFVHAGTAGFFDEGPSKSEYVQALSTPWSGISFPRGTIFDRLSKARRKWRIYACDSFPNVALLKGVSRTFDVDGFDDFLSDIKSPKYDAAYTFIEPSYDPFSEYKAGSSQHPLGTVRSGEMLIKRTYEALRASPIWNDSMLIITYDEHGGFYDHVAPPAARRTGSTGRKYGFRFDRLGPRVPAIIVSPRIPKNLIDHRRYEHSSIVATLTRLFDLDELTVRSSMTSDLKPLASLSEPRTDTPRTLPNPASGVMARLIEPSFELTVPDDPDKPIDEDTGLIAATIASGLAQHLEIAPPSEHEDIIARVDELRTRQEAVDYLKEVDALVREAKQKAGIEQTPTVRLHQLHDSAAEIRPAN
jgi:phospholipase C